jgi:hypothetical protein
LLPSPQGSAFSAAVIATNVVVAGLLTGSIGSPPAGILDAMCKGAFPFLLSTAVRPAVESPH